MKVNKGGQSRKQLFVANMDYPLYTVLRNCANMLGCRINKCNIIIYPPSDKSNVCLRKEQIHLLGNNVLN